MKNGYTSTLPKIAKDSNNDNFERHKLKKRKKNNYKLVLFITLFSIILVSSIGTYAFFTTDIKQKEETVVLKSGTMELEFADNDNGINVKLKFGESATKKFKITNTGTLEASMGIDFNKLFNTYTKGSLTYRVEYSESENGTYKEIQTDREVPVSEEEIKSTAIGEITIPAGETYFYNLIVTYNDLEIDQTSDINATFYTKFSVTGVEEIVYTSEDTLKALNLKVNEGSPDFNKTATTDEGIYAMEDDYGMSYYFRGAVENNYVKFAGFYWRIIRINGDGTLRIMYDGTQAWANGVSNTNRLALTSVVWNTNHDDAKYVGYMYGGSDGEASTSKEQAQSNEISGSMKNELESWYEKNIPESERKAIADEIFCNDRSTPLSSMNLGYGSNDTEYGVYNRLYRNQILTFKCSQDNDKFTTSTSTGNGALTYPVGLITADEIVAAGSGTYNSNTGNNKYYLYKGAMYWSFSPYYYYGFASAYNVNPPGSLGAYSTDFNGGVAPVINLTAKYVKSMSGTGSLDYPFQSNGN